MGLPITIIFYGHEPEIARLLATEERQRKSTALLRDAAVFRGEREDCDQVWVMPSVSDGHRRKLRDTYGDKMIELRDEDMPGKKKPRVPQPPPPRTEAEAKPVAPNDLLRILTNKQLRALADERGIDASALHTRDQLIAALSTAEARLA